MGNLSKFIEEMGSENASQSPTYSTTSIEPKKEPLPEKLAWTSPLFGRLEAGPVLEMTETHFSLVHPLTGEKVILPNEWLDSLDERSSILEFDAGLPREEADRQARIEFFGLFREGGKP